jgi:hypothetical protein
MRRTSPGRCFALFLALAAYAATERLFAGAISGCVVHDLACNGEIDKGTDIGLEGITVDVLDLEGNVIASTTSSNDIDLGFYSFDGLPDAPLQVRVGAAPGLVLGSIQCTSTLGACVDASSNPVQVDLSKASLIGKLNFLFCTPPTGACCLEGGSCVDGVTRKQCAAGGGVYQGDDTICSQVRCDEPKGACCLADGTCVDGVTAEECAAQGGSYQGDSSICSQVQCEQPKGACCLADGTCVDGVTAEECAAQGGAYQGDRSECANVECERPKGACCLEDGTCADGLTAKECAARGGEYQGDNSDCASTDCGGTEGCTPGFWKQDHHLRFWRIAPSTPFDDVFDNAFPGKTLLQVVRLTGGGLNRLGAHAVSAYLNALAVDYPLSAAEVVEDFNAAFASGDAKQIEATKDRFDEFNNLGCPLGGPATENGDRAARGGGQGEALSLTLPEPEYYFRRGDLNASGRVDLTDALVAVNWIFGDRNKVPNCLDAADSNDDGSIDLSDSVHLLVALFVGTAGVPAPGIDGCGLDPTEDLLPDCDYQGVCE